LRQLNSFVAEEGGEILQLSPPQETFTALAPALDELRDLATGALLRPEGLQFYSTQKTPDMSALRELMETIHLDLEWQTELDAPVFHSATDAFHVWKDSPRLYHSTRLLDYVVMRYVGWIDPMDLEWFRTERVNNALDVVGCDYGFSLSWNLRDSLSYGRSGFGGSFAEELYKVCARTLPPALEALRDQTVVLAIDTAGLKRAFPTGHVFWIGTDDTEVCCPMLPADTPEVGIAPIAIVRWPLRQTTKPQA